MKKEWARIGRGVGFKVVFILVLVGVLALGLGLQDQLVTERQGFRDEAVSRTVSEWGGEQRFAGPFLRIPYRTTVSKGPQGTEIKEGFAYFLPEEFVADANLATEVRARGIYEVPLYRATVEVSGHFSMPRGREVFPVGAEIHPEKAELYYFLSGARGLDERPRVTWGGQPQESTRVSSGNGTVFDALAVPVEVPAPGTDREFHISLAVKGGASFGIFPAGRNSLVTVGANGGFPEFGGDFLPSSRSIAKSGFQAEWRIPSLARSVPTFGTSESWETVLSGLSFASFQLGAGFDGYQIVNRALKYGLLFILIPFVGLFLYEIFVRVRLHPVQYLLVGLAVAMFYLLVLPLSERMDFAWSYLIGATAVCALLGVYGGFILGRKAAGFGFFLGMAGLYGLLFLILGSEDNALLVGSLFLFFLLAAVMIATRRVNWYQLEPSEPATES